MDDETVPITKDLVMVFEFMLLLNAFPSPTTVAEPVKIYGPLALILIVPLSATSRVAFTARVPEVIVPYSVAVVVPVTLTTKVAGLVEKFNG